MKEKTHLGGQALIEGVFIKSKEKITRAVRKDDKIIVEAKNYKSLTEKSRILKLPLIRGIIILVELLVYGMSSLIWSANMQEVRTEQSSSRHLGTSSCSEKAEKLSKKEITGSLALSIIVGVGLFVFLPYFITNTIIKQQGIFFNFIDGGIRVTIFFSYLLLISRMKDIQRVFQYHGAEHMAVHCYEADKKLTVKNVKKFTTVHPRCGTSFLMFVLIISILVFSFITFQAWYYNVSGRIILIPLITGFSYELIKISEKWKKLSLFKLFMLPGLWVQKITTQQPDDKQIEVAIKAVKSAL